MNIATLFLLVLVVSQSFLFYFKRYRYLSLISFVGLIVLVPEFEDFGTIAGTFYYFYFFPILTLPKLIQLKKGKLRIGVLFFFIVGLIFYILLYFNSGDFNHFSFFLKDFFALFLVIYFFLLVDFPIDFNNKQLNKHLFLIGILSVIGVIYSKLTGAGNLTNTTSVGFFLGVFLVQISNPEKVNTSRMLLILSVAALLLLGNRTIIFIALLLILKENLRFRRNLLFLLLIGSFIVWQFGTLILDSEIGTLLNLDYVIEYLFSNRFSPFYDVLEQFNNFQDYFWGLGIGTSFYIPWFAGLQFGHDNVYSPTIDNLYLTLFAKYGLFSLFILVILFRIFKQLGEKRKFFMNSLIFLVIYLFTTTLIYQSIFIPLLLSLVIQKTFLASTTKLT